MSGPFPQTFGVLAAPFAVGPNDTNERSAFAVTIPAGVLSPGATIALRGGGRTTTGGQAPAMDFRARLGPTSLAGAILGQHHEGGAPAGDLTWRLWAANNTTDEGFWFDLGATVQANGTDVVASGFLVSHAVGQIQYGVLPVKEEVIATLNPAVDNILEVTLRVDRATSSFILTHARASLEWWN